MRSKEALRRWFEENYPNRVVDVQIPYDARYGHTHTHTHKQQQQHYRLVLQITTNQEAA
jgi:hypothetical protein